MPDEEPLPVEVESASSPITVVRVPRVVPFHSLTESGIEALFESGTSLHMAFLGMAAGAFVSVIASLVSANMSDRVLASFIAGLILTGVLVVYFSVRAGLDYRHARRRVRTIIDRRERHQ